MGDRASVDRGLDVSAFLVDTVQFSIDCNCRGSRQPMRWARPHGTPAADLIVYDEDPRVHIEALPHPRHVLLNGVMIR